MSHADVAPLLHLQECDIRLADIIKSLNDFPLEIAAFKEKIAQEQKIREAAETEFKALELKHRELEAKIEDSEEHCRKLRNQQLSVKKNEEYRALETEIEHTQEQAGHFEDEAIALLIEIDEARDALELKRKAVDEQISEYNGSIALIEKNLAQRLSEKDGAQKDVAAAEKDVSEADLRLYKFVKGQVKRAPWVVPLQNQICSGCHLKISGDLDTSMRKSSTLSRCNNCCRILY
ncbi:MAG: hypothetical protein JW739_08735 [Opitutales bacterium]|nr:hypothetical protein [Opitutales bacterium]